MPRDLFAESAPRDLLAGTNAVPAKPKEGEGFGWLDSVERGLKSIVDSPAVTGAATMSAAQSASGSYLLGSTDKAVERLALQPLDAVKEAQAAGIKDFSSLPDNPLAGSISKAYTDARGHGDNIPQAALAGIKELGSSPVLAAKYLVEMMPSAILGGGIGGAGAKGLTSLAANKLALSKAKAILASDVATGAGFNAGATALGGVTANIADEYKATGDFDKSMSDGMRKTAVETAIASVMGMPLNVGGHGVASVTAKALALSPADEMLQTYAGNKSLGRETSEGELAAAGIMGAMSSPQDIAGAALFKSPTPMSERAAADSARQKTNVTGEPHEVVAHPEVAGKFAAVPASSAAQGVSQPASSTAQSSEHDILSGGIGAPELAAAPTVNVAPPIVDMPTPQEQAMHSGAAAFLAGDITPENHSHYIEAGKQRIAEATRAKQEAAQAKQDKAILATSMAASVAMPSSAPAAQIAAHVGHPSEIVMPDNTDLKAQWEVVDADHVTASLKEGVSQPRDRNRAASNAQVQSIANNPDYRRLADSPMMDYGAPTLSQDGAIVGGNGRFEGVSRAYDNGTAAEYLARLKVDAQTKGIDPAIIDMMRKPVLVRRITQPFDTRALAVASNSGGSLQYSALEMAKLDGERMKHLSDIEVGDQGDIQLSGANMANVRRALTGYNAAELGSMTDKDGMLSQEGLRRLKGAMIYKAYGDSPMLTRLLESTDNELRGVSGALMRAAGKVAKVRGDIESGVIPAEFDIAADIVGAVEQLSKIKATGATVEAYLAQQSLLGAEISADATSILRFLSDNIRSQKRMAEFISSYYDALANEDHATGGMFSDIAPATKKERLNAAIKQNSRTESSAGNIARGEAGKQDRQQPTHEIRIDGSNGKGAGSERFALAGQTAAEVKAQEQARLESERATQHEAQQAREAQAAKDQAEVDAKVKARTGNADNFQFGESSRDAAKPVADLFAQPSKKAIEQPAKVTIMATGKPFPSARAAQLSIDSRKLDAVPVAVEGGFGIQHKTEEEIARAQADSDMQDALADLGAIMRDVARVQRIIPENKPALMRVLVRLFDAAFRKGYYDLKDAARYVRKLMSENEATKAGAQFIPEAMMNEAASKAASTMPEGFFDNQGLFGQAAQQEVSAEPAQASMTNADKKRSPENFVLPPLHSFIDAKTLQDTHDTIAKYKHLLVNKEVVPDPDEVEFAKLAIAPVLAKAEKNFAAFKEAVIDIAHESGIGQMVTGIKKMDRCVEKMLDPVESDYTTRDLLGRLEEVHANEYLRDTLRATIVVQSYDDVDVALKSIGNKFAVERVKDRVRKPDATGYRDFLVNVILADGLKAEIQINTPEMLAAKDLGHKTYAIQRSTKEGSIAEVETKAAQLQLYGAAFSALAKGYPHPVSTQQKYLNSASVLGTEKFLGKDSRLLNSPSLNKKQAEQPDLPASEGNEKNAQGSSFTSQKLVPAGNSSGNSETGNLSGNLFISNSSKHTIAKNASDSKLEEKARTFAEHHHGAIDQRRKFTNEPYITHPAGVVEVLKTVAHTPEMVAAAWAHDTVEDTKATIEDVRRELGDKVASLVAELTKPAVAQSAEAQTIKLSDIIHNLSGLADADPVFAKRYAKEKAIQIGKLADGDAALQARAKGIADALEAGNFKGYDNGHENLRPSVNRNERKIPTARGGVAGERQSGTVRGRLRGRNELSNNLPSLFDSRQTGDEQNGQPAGKNSDIQRGKPSSKGNHPVRNVGIPAGHDIPAKSGLNYHFTDEDLKGHASWLGRARQNVEAVELVKKLQSESRQATRAEQAALAKFIGWGAADIRNNLFDPKLNAKLELMAKYHEAVAALGSKPYLTNAVYKEYFPAFTVLQSKSPTLSWYSAGNITRAMLDAARPDVAVTNWGALRDRLKAVMSEEEWKTAERSTQYAHYTGKEIVNSMWGAMDRMGFKGGAILEPGAGTGVFAGLMNAAVANNSSYTGIEYDAFTGAILKQLQPDERILTESFIDSTLPDNFYDVAIGNPPFSDTKVLSDPRYKKHNFALHDYFFAKTIDKVKPGGLMMFVTSRHTMDKQGDKARQYLAERADLMGAIRLPQTAFKNAGTEVVTDIIFLRKKVAGEVYEGHKWLGLNEVKVKGGKHLVNEYFAAHPEMVLGEGALESGQFGQQYTVLPNKSEAIEAQLANATALLPSGVFNPQNGTAAKAAQVREFDFNPKAKKEGNYYVNDKGELMQVENRIGVPVTMRSKADQVMVADYVPLRDALNQAQYDQLNNGDWEVSLKHLHTAYKKFVAKHGNVLQNTVIERTTKEVDEDTGETLENTTLTRKFTLIDKLRDDFESSKLLGLETINDDTGEIKESPFFTQRTLLMRRKAVINTPHDALLSSLNDIGAVDIPLIAKRIGLSESEVIAALGTSIYESPSQGWQMADEYLSGNVKQKLKEAQAAAKTSRRYERNVEALIAAQPSPVPPSDITASLGMNWIPTNIYEQVLLEKAGVKANITYNEHTGNWSVAPISGHGTVAATVDWGTNKRNAADIMEAGLTGRQIRITETVGSGADRKSVFDAAGTEQAVQKLKELRTAFSEWLWQDGARTDKLVTLYNDKFNTSVSRQFNGAHLTLPGTTSTITVFDHVKRGAWRIIQTGNTYLAHAVGAGKTWAMVISAMEQKRLGLINKPMMVVPNHMLQQFAQEWLQLYPAARLMVADEKQFHTDNRRRFVSRVSMSDLDGVIITHSAFKLLDLDPDFKAKVIQEKLDNLEAALTDIQTQEGESSKGKSRNPKVRDIQGRIEKMEEKLKAVMSSEGKDKNVRFDEMGVDFLYVDEAHEYRKLEFTTLRQMKGISSTGSDRAADLQMKAQWLEEHYPGRSLVLASGTPITNTMAEMYTVQRFMNPRALEEKGLQDFDAWASMFGEEQTEIEADASGKYAPVTRFSNMVNVPELTQMFREYADVLTSDHLGEMLGDYRPKVKGGARVMRVTPQVDAYLDFKQELADRLLESRAWKPSPAQPNNPDPVIRIIGDGRLAAIDMRFIDNTLPNDPASKLNQLADGVIEAYKKGKDYEYKDKSGKVEAIKGSTQMVFSDLGFGAGVTEHRGFDARKWFERRLNSAGIPMSQIAFMSDHKKSADKAKLFKDMNAGRVRILVGSSKNMGTGVNAQQRLRVLHHLDTPWYPADLEQREGRIIRQGNKNRHVQIYAYSTKGSYDTNMWQLLARKQGFIDQAMSGDASVRRLEDISEVSQYQMATAMTAGNEDAIRLAGVSAELSRYDRLFRAHEEQRMRMKEGFALAGNTIAVSERLLPIAEKMAAQVQDLSGDKFTAKVGKKSFDNRKEFGAELLGKFKVFSDNLKEGSEKLGEISGFPIEAVGNIAKDFKGNATGYQVELELRLGEDWVVLARDANEDAVGVAIRANNALVVMARKPDELQQRIEEAKAKRSALESRMDSKFQFTAEYAAKKLEARELKTKLEADSLVADSVKVESKTVSEETPVFSKREKRSDLPPVSQSVIDGLITRLNRIIGHTAGEASISVVFAVDELPEAILVQAATEKIPHDEILGVLHNGRAYIVRQNIKTKQEAEETLVHEVMGHGGVHALLGDARETVLSESFQRAGGIGGLRAIAKHLGVLKELDQRLPKTTQLSSAEKIAVVDELLALAQGKQDGLRQLALEWLGKMRNFIIAGLRKAGLHSIAAKLDKFDATETVAMLRQMREAVIDGGDIGGHGVAFMVAPAEYARHADMFMRAAEKMGLEVNRDSSRVSMSQYVTVEDADYELSGGEKGHHYKFRFSNHKLPNSYEQANYDVVVGDTAHFDTAGDWQDAIKWLAEKTGRNVPAVIKALDSKAEKSAAKAAEKYRALKIEQAREKLAEAQSASLDQYKKSNAKIWRIDGVKLYHGIGVMPAMNAEQVKSEYVSRLEKALADLQNDGDGNAAKKIEAKELQEKLQADTEVAKFSRKQNNSDYNHASLEVSEHEALRGIDSLNQAIRRDIGSNAPFISKSVSLDSLARDGGAGGVGAARSFQLAAALATHFRQKVVTFENHNPERFDFNGVSFGGKIYLNAKANRPAHVIFGHEFLHELRKGQPAAYDKLMTVLEPMMKDLEGFRQLEGIEAHRDVDYLKEELAANLVGNRFGEASFWRTLLLKAPKQFQYIVELAVKMLSEIHHLYAGNKTLKGDEFITDVAKAREAIAEAVARYNRYTGKSFEPKYMVAWHGSPNDHDRFDNSYFGEGEGASGFGYGMHFTDTKSDAQHYKEKLEYSQGSGKVYKVDIPDVTKMLDLSKQISEQSTAARKALEKLDGLKVSLPQRFGTVDFVLPSNFIERYGNSNGMSLFAALQDEIPADYTDASNDRAEYAASKILASVGLKGNTHTEFSGKRNYVVFDDADISIMAKFSRAASPNYNAFQRDLAMPDPNGFDIPEETAMQKKQRQLQDHQNRWRMVQEAVVEQGGKIEDKSNVFQALKTYPGRVAAAFEAFQRSTVDPLLERVTKAKIDLADVEEYLYALHAPERNRQIASINDNFPDGGSGMTNSEAAKVVEKYTARANFAEFSAIAKDFQKITSNTQKLLVKYGVHSQEHVDSYSNTYKNYVPLKGFEEIDADGKLTGNGTGSGHSTSGKLDKRAMGRRSKAGQILANIMRDHEAAILAAEKSNVGRVVRNFVLANPDARQWTVEKIPQQNVIVKTAEGEKTAKRDAQFDPEKEIQFIENDHAVRIQFADDLLPRAYNKTGMDTPNEMLRLACNFNSFLRQMYTQKNPAFFLINPMRDIQTLSVQLTGDAGAKVSAKAFKHWGGAWLAVMRHAMQDKAGINSLTGKVEKAAFGDDLKAWQPWMNSYLQSGGSVGFAYVGDIEVKQSKLQDQLHRLGGASVFTELSRMWQAGMIRDVASAKRHGVSAMQRALFKLINNQVFDLIEHLNSAFENASRLATFRACVESGMTAPQAAVVAKNVTTNFNDKGEVGSDVNALWLFANANIQGTANVARVLTKSKHRKQVWAMVAGIAALGLMAGADEDDDDEIKTGKEYEKQRYWRFDLGDGKRFTLPKPYGWSFFYDLGRSMGHLYRDPNKIEEESIKVASSFLGNFSPVGNLIPSDKLNSKDAVQILPTVLKPFGQVATNRSFFGGDLMPENAYKDNQPDSEKVYRKTRGSIYDDLAKGLNHATGGDVATAGRIDISPETLKLVATFLTGGAGRFLSDSYGTGSEIVDGAGVSATNAPIVRMFYRETNVDDYRARFYEQSKEAAAVKERMGAYKSAKEFDKRRELIAEQGKLAGLASAAKNDSKKIKGLRDAEDMIRADKLLSPAERKAQIKANEDRQIVITSKFNEQYKKAQLGLASVGFQGAN